MIPVFQALSNVTGFSRLDGQRLIAEADLLLQRPRATKEYHDLVQAKAVEIGDFLSENGEWLDQNQQSWIVDALGVRVDMLAKASRGTLQYAQGSSWAAGVESFNRDVSTATKIGLPVVAILAIAAVLAALK